MISNSPRSESNSFIQESKIRNNVSTAHNYFKWRDAWNRALSDDVQSNSPFVLPASPGQFEWETHGWSDVTRGFFPHTPSNEEMLPINNDNWLFTHPQQSEKENKGYPFSSWSPDSKIHWNMNCLQVFKILVLTGKIGKMTPQSAIKALINDYYYSYGTFALGLLPLTRRNHRRCSPQAHCCLRKARCWLRFEIFERLTPGVFLCLNKVSLAKVYSYCVNSLPH